MIEWMSVYVYAYVVNNNRQQQKQQRHHGVDEFEAKRAYDVKQFEIYCLCQ